MRTRQLAFHPAPVEGWRACALAALVLIGCGAPPEEGLPEADGGLPDASVDAADAGHVVPDAGAPDAGPVDAGAADSGSADGGVADAGPALVPALYPFKQRHSPMTAAVAANLQRIAGLGTKNGASFSKIGDSNTVNTSYLTCFGGTNVDLAGRTSLQPTVDVFKPSGAYAHVSQAATVGWSAGAAITGTPTPLENEVAAMSPRYATVMFGTNDIGDGTGDVFKFARNMFAITDALIAKGVVPLLSTLPPRDDSTAGDARIPEFEGVIHGIAQARQVPLMDLDQAMRVLPSHGLGPDGLHLNVYLVGGAGRGCIFTPAGLAYGNNTRNLLTIEALARAKAAVDSAAAPDVASALQGAGTLADPYVVPSLPFTDVRDTSKAFTNRISAYAGCASAADESGPEVLYKLTVATATAVRIQVHALGTSDIDVHLMSDPASGAGCTIRNDRQIVTTLQPGTWWLSLDTYQAKSGEYLLSIVTP